MNSDMNSNSNIEEAKSRLPLPKLMQELGYGERAKSNARCMFHDDKNPSFGIFQRNAQWFWKCQAGCGHGDEIHFLAKAKGIDVKDALKEFLRMAGVEGKASSAPKQAEAIKEKAVVQLRSLDQLLDAVCEALRRYVVFPLKEQPVVISLWVLHTWAFAAFDYTAYLSVWAASKRAGKSRVLDVLELLVKNPVKTESGSSAALIRSIDEKIRRPFLGRD